MANTTHPTKERSERAFLVGVDSGRKGQEWQIEDSLAELSQLARTAGAEVVGQLTQRLSSPHPASYIGSGKLEELLARKVDIGYDVAIFDDELSPSQQRNLEEALNAKVLDRTALILDIFAHRAQTREGRLQVELAQHEYLLPRLAGQWSHLERLGGGIGTRGPGETQLETDRRLVRRKIGRLKAELEGVRRHRALYRRQRESRGMPVVALVGYTNAGKSTLLNALTGAGVLVEDKLFATLDPTTRRVFLPSRQEVLVTDTVGFIQKLPHAVVAAFRATLEELEEADLLLHVLDITHPNAAEQAATVGKVLGELGLGDKPVLLALNKVDRLLPPERIQAEAPEQLLEEVRQAAVERADAVFVSAALGWGLERLLAKLETQLGSDMVEVTVLIPYQDSSLVELFRAQGLVDEEKHVSGGTLIHGRLPRRLRARFAPYRPRPKSA